LLAYCFKSFYFKNCVFFFDLALLL